MSISITDEQLIRISDVPKLKNFPPGRSAERVHVATMYRWASRGLRGVTLETLNIGETRCTSLETLQRFFERLTQSNEIGSPEQYNGLSSTERSRQRHRQLEDASRRLRQLGI